MEQKPAGGAERPGGEMDGGSGQGPAGGAERPRGEMDGGVEGVWDLGDDR